MILLNLFLTFAKIGLFTFGGGYAMIALIEDICVEKKRWITHDEMMNDLQKKADLGNCSGIGPILSVDYNLKCLISSYLRPIVRSNSPAVRS